MEIELRTIDVPTKVLYNYNNEADIYEDVKLKVNELSHLLDSYNSDLKSLRSSYKPKIDEILDDILSSI